MSFVAGIALGACLGAVDAQRLLSTVTAPFSVDSEQDIEVQEPEPTELNRQLDGKLVDAADAHQFPYCVMIENAAFDGVRPQSGLPDAEIVYEVIVEGGITRFMAVFGDSRPERIGPVRSARDNFVEFAYAYDCPYYHAGGSDTGLQHIRDLGMRDVDGLIEYQYFWRDPLKFGPHDFFTSGKLLQKAAKEHGWHNEPDPDFVRWERVDETGSKTYTTSAKSELADSVFVGYDPGYEAEWTYNGNSGVYKRKTAGVPHLDAETQKPLTAKNIVLLHVGDGQPIPGKGRINWPVIGRGKVDIVYGGRVYRGFWRKAGERSRLQFVDDEGNRLPLAIGNTWVQVVPPHVEVTIQ